MISRFIFATAIFMTASAAKADHLYCKITAAKDGTMYSQYIGGTILVHLESATTTLAHAGIVFQPISGETVGSFQANRSRCIHGTEKILSGDVLRGMKLKFNDCPHRDPKSGMVGYVQADVSFDLQYDVGKYREIFRTARGPVPTAWVDFEKCGLITGN